MLSRQSISLENAPLCDSSQDLQACPAPNDVAARVVQWAHLIADHLKVDEMCGSVRRFPDCFYTWKGIGFPEAVTHYSEQLCHQNGDCASFWALTEPERFQCVSLVRGAYSQVYPMPTSDDAFKLWDDYRVKKGWKAIAVSAPGKQRGLPLPGDIVIIRKYNDFNAGHTGIVTEVSAPDQHGNRRVRYANANSGVRYDEFTVHPDYSVPYLWNDPGVTVWGYLRPDLPVTQQPYPSGKYSIVGKPTVSSDLLNEVLAQAGSPAAGKGQALYDLGVKYGIDPVYALAFFQHESTFGKYGVAPITHSLGNMRCMNGYACYHDEQNGAYALFGSWEQGFEAWYRMMRDQYVNAWHLETLDAIIPKYAPAADHNNEREYIRSVERAVDTWRSGNI